MRLLASEQKSIHKIMVEHDLSDRYLLVKRRGWVLVQVGESTFAFHRKDIAHIEGGKFRNSRQYFVRIEKEERSVKDFSEVEAELDLWLASLEI